MPHNFRSLAMHSKGVDTLHPHCDDHSNEWRTMRDVLRGQEWIKRCRELYLPKSAAQKKLEELSGCGKENSPYHAYLRGARFPNITEITRQGFVGIATRQPWKIENLPAAMSYLENNAGNGLALDAWQGLLISEGLGMGRYALFPDAPERQFTDTGAEVRGRKVRIQWYETESITNWKTDSGEPELVVLKESIPSRNGDDDSYLFSHDCEDQYRVFKRLSDNSCEVTVHNYVDSDKTFEMNEKVTILNDAEDAIPVYIGGAINNDWDVDRPPLMGVSECAIAYYILSAQQRWAIRHSCDPTFLAKGFGEGDIKFMGGGGLIETEAADATLEAVEITGEGIQKASDEMREELELAREQSHQLMDKSAAEASSSLRQRSTSKTASLKSVDRCGAEALQNSLNRIARINGLTPNITVTSSFDYTDDEIDAQVLGAISQAVSLGQLPKKAVPEYVQDRGLLESIDMEEIEAMIEQDAEDNEADEVGLGDVFNPADNFRASNLNNG